MTTYTGGTPPNEPWREVPDDGPIPFRKKGAEGPTDAPRGKGGKTPTEEKYSHWVPVPIGDLVVDEMNTDWIWHGFLGAQVLTLFIGLWKSGKSTLLSVMLQSLDGQHDQFCGQAIKPATVIVVTEEAPRHWIERRDLLGIGNHVHVVSRPFIKSDKPDWLLFVAYLAGQVKDLGASLVIFDSIFNLWPVTDENNAAEVKDALMPLNAIMEQGAGVMLVAHPKKGDASEAQASRGTGALPAYVDIIMEMRRFDAERREDTRRVITTYSRFEETPEELVIEYLKHEHRYIAAGTRSDAKSADRIKVLMDILPAHPTAYTLEEILQNWPQDGIPRPARSNLQRDLERCIQDRLVSRRGVGKKNDPMRYFRPPGFGQQL